MGRRRTVTISSVLVALALTAVPLPARAHTELIRIVDFGFRPAETGVLWTDPTDPATDHPIRWRNDGRADHRISEAPSQEGLDLATGRLEPGERSRRIAIAFAGRWRYVCLIHPQMEGTIVVRPALHPHGEPGNGPVAQRPRDFAALRLANGPLPDDYVFQVQRRYEDRPWRSLYEHLDARRLWVSPNTPGDYRFRVRLFHRASGGATGWVKSKTLTVT